MYGAVPTAEKFLSQFVESYDPNKKFRESIDVSLVKAAMCKLTSSHNNPIIEERSLDLSVYLAHITRPVHLLPQPIWAVLPTDT